MNEKARLRLLSCYSVMSGTVTLKLSLFRHQEIVSKLGMDEF